MSQLSNRRTGTFLVASVLVLLLPGFRKAEVELPESFHGRVGAPLGVEGQNPRRWGRPLGFGAYRTVAVHEGAEFSWSLAVFGVRGGSARQRYQLVLEGPEGRWEVECRARAIEAWRDGFAVELTPAFRPSLSCGLSDPEGQISRFVLASDGRTLRGRVEAAAAGGPQLLVRSIHRLEGTRLPLAEPAGYVLESPDGDAVAAVETINAGRVWLSDGSGGQAPAIVAALLLYKVDLTPRMD